MDPAIDTDATAAVDPLIDANNTSTAVDPAIDTDDASAAVDPVIIPDASQRSVCGNGFP